MTSATGIFATDDIVINGGQVTAASCGNGQYGMWSHQGDIILGWTNPTDFIKATSYRVDDANTSGKVVKIADGLVLKYTDGDNNTVKLMGDLGTTLDGHTLTPYGADGYCGATTQNDGKDMTWEIPLVDHDNNPGTPMTLSTTLTITGSGAMADYSGSNTPWKGYTVTAVHIVASDAMTGVDGISADTPVTLSFTEAVLGDCTQGYIVTTGSGDAVSMTTPDSFAMPATAVSITPVAVISFPEGETWMTWCDHRTWTMPQGIEAYTVAAISAQGEVSLNKITGTTIPAHTPLLLHKTDADVKAVFSANATGDALVSQAITNGETDDVVATLWGNATDAAISDGGFTANGLTAYCMYNGGFVRIEDSQTVKAHRWLLTMASAMAPESLTIGNFTGVPEGQGDDDHFGHITYNGNATGGTLEFYTSPRVFEENIELTLTNGQSAALTSEDISYSRVYIKATPAEGRRLPVPAADGTVGFIRAEVVASGVEAQRARLRSTASPTMQVGQTLPVKFDIYNIGGTSDSATDYYGSYYVEMPADANLSVSITADFPEVKKNTAPVSYVDADGVTKSKAAGEVYVLDGTEAILGYGSYNDQTRETWYVCNDDINYANGLECYGKVHLILADGATMTVGTDSKPVAGTPINHYGDLTIYGQGNQSGMLTATSSESDAIHVSGDLVINGGIINAKSDRQDGIRCQTNLTINGGTVTGTSVGGTDSHASL